MLGKFGVCHVDLGHFYAVKFCCTNNWTVQECWTNWEPQGQGWFSVKLLPFKSLEQTYPNGSQLLTTMMAQLTSFMYILT